MFGTNTGVNQKIGATLKLRRQLIKAGQERFVFLYAVAFFGSVEAALA